MTTTPSSTATWRRISFAALSVVACNAVQAQSDETPAATPYRPSVSTPAALSAPGWLEVEGGILGDHSDGRRDSLPYTLKLAFTPDWGIRFGGEAWVRQTDASGQRLSGFGDSVVVLKRRFAVDDTSAFGLEAGATLPTARHGLGAGKSNYSINGIYSADIGAFHIDTNLVATRIGAPDAGTGRTQGLWAAALSRSLNDQWSVVGEFSGTHQSGTDNTAQFLAAASYSITKSFVLDAGFAHSLRSDTPDWQLFTGFTLVTARLF